MREAGIMLISAALTCAVIGNAYYQRKQFYPTVVHITKSNPSMTVIYAQTLILVFMINAFLRKLFFGTLRAAELEHLVEKVWYAVTETCLAFTVFRDDFSPKFIALFTLLLFLKSFHWLAEDRVDYMERSPVITWLFHLRVVTLLGLLFIINLTMIHYAYNTTATKGPSVQLVFGFEYAILLTVVINITVKYVLHTIDLQSENPWDNKPVFLLYTDLVIGLLKVALYVAFVSLMIKLFTLPLFALRPMYYTMRDFKKAFHDIVMSRRAIRNMNTLYPDATPEELAAADNVCIICREEMVSASKKLPCNHIFHTACLRSWFQRQQTCPTCRLNILRPTTNNTGTRQQNPQQNQQAPQPPPAPVLNPQGQGFQLPGFWAGLQAPGVMPQPQGQNNAGTVPLAPFPNLPTGSVPIFAPPFPPMVPLPPIPTPPPNLTELTEDELRAMEGNLRQAVEARIQTLQRVQLLLDAANAMMNQYQAAAATANIPKPTVPTSAPSASAQTTATTSAPEENKDVPKDTAKKQEKDTCLASTSEGESYRAAKDTDSASVSNKVNESNVVSPSCTSNNEIASESSSKNETEPTSDQEMLRRRRLQKFLAPTSTE
ncbi:PREDICTED: E3 ubiquitin-protein ligase synoviolin A isoform X1 [Polistes dominula]|uniref:RING-type E3 ubiquitin transferase n=1 Tax=Polistes dominula TaxID=743375 RepID=A0ABM1HTK6_POLDO|nr:PREDICTED: E3 ubiquitin-protein ligase synoviolin A isoform X1 [Polistes dominula]